MPEGHSVHRIALQFRRNFVGHRCTASSPQGRFAAGAAQLDGREMVASDAVGKHLLLGFEGDLTLHVHLGLYGAWDFAGEVSADPTFTSAGGRMGQTNQRGTGPTRAGSGASRSDVTDEPVGKVDDLTGLRPGALGEAPEALLAVANCQAELKDTKSARRTIDELLKAYPGSEAAQAGRERLALLR